MIYERGRFRLIVDQNKDEAYIRIDLDGGSLSILVDDEHAMMEAASVLIAVARKRRRAGKADPSL